MNVEPLKVVAAGFSLRVFRREKDMGIKERVSEILLKIGAVYCNLATPYVFTSGLNSPVYVDFKKIISYPEECSEVLNYAYPTIELQVGRKNFETVAGGENTCVAFASWISLHFRLPLCYILRESKTFGWHRRIEGDIKKNQKVLLVEDVNTDARMMKNYSEILKKAGAKVEDVFVFFDYGCFPETKETLKEIDVKLHYLSDWETLYGEAKKLKAFSDKEMKEIRIFLNDPWGWSNSYRTS